MMFGAGLALFDQATLAALTALAPDPDRDREVEAATAAQQRNMAALIAAEAAAAEAYLDQFEAQIAASRAALAATRRAVAREDGEEPEADDARSARLARAYRAAIDDAAALTTAGAAAQAEMLRTFCEHARDLSR